MRKQRPPEAESHEVTWRKELSGIIWLHRRETHVDKVRLKAGKIRAGRAKGLQKELEPGS